MKYQKKYKRKLKNMVNENLKVIVENKKPVEEVREIENEIPSFEEFMKTYEPSEESELLTEAEYQDRVLHGSQYGPGNEQSKNAAKEIGGTMQYSILVFGFSKQF